MYNYITNPYTGEKVSIYNKLGKDIITNYLVYNKYGGAVDEPPVACYIRVLRDRCQVWPTGRVVRS